MSDSRLKYNNAYYERDPKKKTREWATPLVTALREEWKPIVDIQQVQKNREILRAKQDLDDIKEGAFTKGETFAENHDWIAIDVMQRIARALCAEFQKGNYTPNVEAVDPTATAQKERDRNLLALRSMLEGPLSDINRRVGNPAEKIDKDEFAGDVDKFDELGLDSNDPTDVNFFMERFHRLWHEVASQMVVKSLLQYNKFDQRIPDLVDDVLAAGCVAYETYASPFTGEIKWKHRLAEEIRAILGQEKDGSDAPAVGYEKNSTVRHFLELAGPAFDFARDHDYLLNAVNFHNYTNYVKIDAEGCWEMDSEGKLLLAATYHTMLAMTVGIGKMEFKSIDGEAQLKHNKSGFLFDVDYSEDTSNRKEYTRQIREYERTYKTYFLVSGAQELFLFRFGPLYHQVSYGASDEYSCYSIHFYLDNGKPAVQIAEPFIKIANLAFHKIVWGLYESLPTIENLNYEALARLLVKIKPEGAAAQALEAESGVSQVQIAGQLDGLIKRYTSSLRRVYSSVDENGDIMGGDNRPHYREDGKVDQLAIGMMEVLNWADEQVSTRLGVNPLRLAETPNPKDGYKKGQQQIRSSENVTYYVSEMISHIIVHNSTMSLNIAQDAIEVKGTPTYTFLCNLIGEENFISFKDLDKIPAHRYGIFVNVYNTQQDIEDLREEAKIAFAQQQITYDQYLIVKNIDDPKMAGLTMAYFRSKQEKVLAKQAEMEHQRILQQQQQDADLKARNINLEYDWKMKIEDKKGQYMVASYNDANAAALAKKQIDVDSNNQKVNEQADAKIKVDTNKENLKHQAPLPQSAEVGLDQSQVA